MFKSIKNYIRYRNFIINNKDELINNFKFKIDNLYRLGIKISIPDNKINLLITYKNPELDIFKSLNDEVVNFKFKVDNYFMKRNMLDLIKIYSIDRVDYNEVVLIISYKLINIIRLANILRSILVISIFSLSLFLLNILYILPGIFFILIILIINKFLFKKLFV